MTSPVAQAYIDSVSRAAFAGYNDSAAAGQTPDIPNPLEDTDPNRSYTQFNIFRQQQRSETISNDGGDDDTMSPEEYAKQVEYFKNNQFAGVSNKNKVYEDSIAGWLEEKIDKAVAPKVKFNDLTQTYRVTNPGGGINMMLGPLAPFVAIGSFLSQKNLENIQEQVIAGKQGFGIGLLDNAIVGMSPGPFGFGTVSSGMFPETPRGYSTSAHLNNIYSALEAQADAVAKGVAIPDITTAYNIATYGASEGADFGTIPGGGSVVTSMVPNPLGPEYADIKVPVTSGGHSGLPKGYVTTGLSGVSGTDLYNAPPAGPATIADSGAMSPEDIANTFGTPPAVTDNYNYGDHDSGNGGDNNDNNNDSSSSSSSSGGDSFGADSGDYGGMMHAEGGRVGMRNGGEASPQMGFVNKDPRNVSDSQGIADNRFTSVPQGSFVMNQPANEKYKDDLDVVLGDAEKRAGSARNDGNMVDVALSDGERLIRPEVVDLVEKKYGGGFLDNINNTGKPEVQRRQVKYGAKIGAANGGLQADRGFVQQLIGPDSPTLTSPDPDKSNPMNLTSVSPNNDQFFGRRFGDIKEAIKNVEIKGFEKDPYIFTGIKRKGKASSAFGPMQITASTLKDIKTRSALYNMLDQGSKDYFDLLIQQGDDKVNIEKYGSMYRNKKKVNTPAELKKSYRKYGKGTISQDLHEKYYETIANITLRQKLKDHNSLEKALASYGEGDSYASKVLSGLD